MKKLCIFCFRNETEVEFSEEHIIPRNIGGKLTLPEHVCKDCNDKLGAFVDHTLFKIPDIKKGLDKFGISYSPRSVEKHFNVIGILEEFRLRGRLTENGVSFSTQKLPDDSLLASEEDSIDIIKNIVRNDERLTEAGLTEEQIEEELKKLLEEYEKIEPDKEIENFSLGIRLKKRSDKISIKFEPKRDADINQLLAKIVYEFLFLIAGKDFLLSENIAEPLFQFVNTGKQPNSIYIFRNKPNENELKPYHGISLSSDKSLYKIQIIFFGYILYSIILPPFSGNLVNQLEQDLNIADIKHLQYQNEFDKDVSSFWVIPKDGNKRLIKKW